jgi:signal peptidase I
MDATPACGESAPAAPPAWVQAAQALTGPWTWRNFFSWFGLIGAVLVVKGCFVDQYTIPSGSMEPTLIGDPRFFRGDRVIVNKWIFGPRIPFTKTRLWEGESPKRWDIVVFKSVDPKSKHPVLIKRVVGLPGETVQIRDGAIYINDRREDPPQELRKVLHYTTAFTLSPIQIRSYFLRMAKDNRPLDVLNAGHPSTKLLYAEMDRFHDRVKNRDIDTLSDDEVQELVNGVDPAALHTVHQLVELGMQDQELVYGIRPEKEYSVVPEGHYFCLGDNSGQSLDGRVYGWVPKENLLGRAAGIWWPISHRRDFTGFTRTWQGWLMMCGPVAALIGLELAARLRRRRRSRTEPDTGQ